MTTPADVRRLWSMARAVGAGGHMLDAGDLVSEGWLALRALRESGRGAGPGWERMRVLGGMLNARREERRQRFLSRERPVHAVGLTWEPPCGEPGPDEVAECMEQMERLRARIAALPPRELEAVARTLIFGQSLVDVARDWMVDPSRVCTIRARGLAMLGVVGTARDAGLASDHYREARMAAVGRETAKLLRKRRKEERRG